METHQKELQLPDMRFIWMKRLIKK